MKTVKTKDYYKEQINEEVMINIAIKYALAQLNETLNDELKESLTKEFESAYSKMCDIDNRYSSLEYIIELRTKVKQAAEEILIAKRLGL